MSKATIVVDLGFGDAGKGKVVDFLSRQRRSSVIVRHNGGSQAGHNVVTPDGRHHTFSQFGSGLFVPGTRTFLSKYMLVNPLNHINEEEHLRQVGIGDAFQRTYVDQRCIVITPYHKAVNRLRELARGSGRHGSCGEGIGETVDHARFKRPLRVRDLYSRRTTHSILQDIQRWASYLAQGLGWDDKDPLAAAAADLIANENEDLLEIYTHWARTVNIVDEGWLNSVEDDLIFEGAQGVLLDENHGFSPHTTWSTTTFDNALNLIQFEAENVTEITRLGVIRSYLTRHGDGPFDTEDDEMTASLPEQHNGTGVWQGAWRAGHMDVPMIRYALEVSPADALVVTHMDKVPPTGWKVWNRKSPATSGETEHWERQGYAERLADELKLPLHAISYGPTAHETRVMPQQLAMVTT